MLRPIERQPPRPGGSGRGGAVQWPEPADAPRASQGQREREALRARGRHALLLARRHLVDGPVRAAWMAGGLPDADIRPRPQGLHRDTDGRRPLPGHGVARPAPGERGGLPVGRDIQRGRARLLRPRRSAIAPPRQERAGPVHRGLLGLLPAPDGLGADEEALAQPGGPVRGLSGRVVPGRGGLDALLPVEGQGERGAAADGGLDRDGGLHAGSRPVPPPGDHPTRPGRAPHATMWSTRQTWTSSCSRPATPTGSACRTRCAS
jgi:hypothetical protein